MTITTTTMTITTDRSILVAYNQEATRSVLKNILRGVGYHYISMAKNGRKLFKLLMEGEYDLLITAPELPDINCWQVLRSIATGVFCSPRLPALIIGDADQIPKIRLLAQEYRAYTLALNELGTLPTAVHTCLSAVNKPAILVIEDHPDTSKLIQSCLKTSFEVEIASSGEMGLNAWDARRHPLVLLDLMLPGINGPVVLHKILAKSPDQLIVIITARSEKKTHQDLMLAGASAFLTKPIDLQNLPHFCEKLLRNDALLSQGVQLSSEGQDVQKNIEYMLLANHFFGIGQAGLAATQIKHALAQGPNRSLNDDEWIALLNKLEQ